VSVVRINVLQVPAERAEVLEQRFAARAGEVDQVDGFESFDLLRPTDGTDRYLVVTRWRDEAAFDAWMASAAFQKGHAQVGGDAPAAGDGGGHPGSPGGPGGGGHPGGAPGGPGGPGGGGPAAMGSELWSFDVVTSSSKA
jgi:heme oxygenase (mycobilin-producing)